MYGPICAWRRAVDSDTRCFSDPRGPVATTHRSSDPFDRQAVDGDLVTVGQALALDVVEPEPLLAVEEVGQALTEHRHPAGDRAVLGEPLELDGLHDRAR